MEEQTQVQEEVREPEAVQAPEAEPAPQEEVEGRDYARQVRELYEAHPEMRGEPLPQEVVRACVGGENLTQAYSDYARRQRDRTRGTRWGQAPVKGVTRGGGVSTQPEDPFLKGFHDAW